MPDIQTLYFDKLTYENDAVICFPGGLPGFEDQTRFLLIEQERHKPLVYMQSMASAELCFLALPILTIDSGFHLTPNPEDLQTLELPADAPPVIGRDVLCLALLALAENQPPTANLMAPIVINLRTRKAIQAVLADTGYSHCHVLYSAGQEALCS